MDPIEGAIEAALCPGRFIGDNASWPFVDALEGLSHYTTEPAAKRLAKLDPAVAAKLFRALGMRILNARKSKYYQCPSRKPHPHTDL